MEVVGRDRPQCPRYVGDTVLFSTSSQKSSGNIVVLVVSKALRVHYLISSLQQPCMIGKFYYPHITDRDSEIAELAVCLRILSEFIAEVISELGTSWFAT